MANLFAVCGVNCGECEAYIATQNDDDAARSQIAEKWSKMYNADIKTADLNCEGCIGKGDKHFMYCNSCEIRACGMERGLDNCAFCDDYACDKLVGFFKMSPEAKGNLEAIKARQ